MSQQLQQRIRQLESKLQGQNNTLSALGQEPGGQGVIKDFYVYQEDFAAVLAGQSQTGSINVQADSDFVLQKMTFVADLAGNPQTDSGRIIPLMSVQITDTGSGRNLMEAACPIPSIFGTGQIPFILPQPKLFLARSSITITVSNFSAATDYNARLSFIGHKVFRM